MFHHNVSSYRRAMAYGCHLVAEFEDNTNKITKVYSIGCTEREELKRRGEYDCVVTVKRICCKHHPKR